MAVDIAPELYERIHKLFLEKYEKAKLFGSPISEIRAKLDAGTATFRDADLYAAEVGNMLSESMIEVLQLDQMPNGQLYFNIAQRTIGSSLEDTYGLVSSVAAEVQEELNAASGIGIKAVTPKVNSDRIHGLVEKATEAADQAALNNALQSPVENLMMSAVDETVKTNAQLQAKAGLQPIIKRTSTGHCCDWCSALAGTYKYPDDVPDEIYHRHKNCRCTVEYIGAGKRQDVWSKKEDVLTREEAKRLESEIIAKKKDEKKETAIRNMSEIYLKYGSEEKLMLFGSTEDIERWAALKNSNAVTEKDIIQSLYKDVDKWEQILESQTDSKMKKFTDQLFAMVPDEEIDAMSFWSGGAYGNIQQYLRYDDSVNEIYIDAADKIVSGLNRITTEEDLIVRRGTGTRHIFSNFGDSWKENPEELVGKIFTDNGLVATSPFKEGGFGGVGENHAELIVKVPKGTHGAYIAEVAKDPDEKEFLLQRGYSYRIIKAEYIGSKYVQFSDVKNLKVWAEVILNE